VDKRQRIHQCVGFGGCAGAYPLLLLLISI